MMNTSPSLLSPNNAAQVARKTFPPLPPSQPGEPTRQSEQLLAANLHRDNEDAGSYTEVTCHGSARPTILDQKLAKQIHAARKDTQPPTSPVTNVGVTLAETHFTPTRPTAPPEAAPQAASLTNNQFGALALDGGRTTTGDDNGSNNSEPDWDSFLDDVEVPPELKGDDPKLNAIIKMIKDHCREANSCISSMCKYLLEKIQGQSDETYATFWLEDRKREDALLSIWEGIAKDIANTFFANNELPANLAFIKHWWIQMLQCPRGSPEKSINV
jgi:hypothetical protein